MYPLMEGSCSIRYATVRVRICKEDVSRLTRENLLASGHGGRNGILDERQAPIYNFHAVLGFTIDKHGR